MLKSFREKESRYLQVWGRLGNVSERLEQRESSETFRQVVHARTVVGCWPGGHLAEENIRGKPYFSVVQVWRKLRHTSFWGSQNTPKQNKTKTKKGSFLGSNLLCEREPEREGKFKGSETLRQPGVFFKERVATRDRRERRCFQNDVTSCSLLSIKGRNTKRKRKMVIRECLVCAVKWDVYKSRFFMVNQTWPRVALGGTAVRMSRDQSAHAIFARAPYQ